VLVQQVHPLERADFTEGLRSRQRHLQNVDSPTLDYVLASLNGDFDKSLVSILLDLVREKGVDGLPQSELHVSVSESLSPSFLTVSLQDFGEASDIDVMLTRLTQMQSPPVLQVGFSQRRVVSTKYLTAWALQSSDSTDSFFVPRQWLDIDGNLIEEIAQQSCLAVMAALHLHAAPTAVRLLGVLATH
jgi:hypothetical protein